MTTLMEKWKLLDPKNQPHGLGPTPQKVGRARVTRIRTQSIITPGTGFMSAYDGVINPYQGCAFGCDYCYASNFTSTDSKKQDWGRWVAVKTNAVQEFHRIPPGQMNDRTYYMSTITDPYQPAEREVELTRKLLEAMLENQPRMRLVIQTRAPLVVRDADLFLEMARRGAKVQVNMTVTTDDENVRRAFEPGCPSVTARLKAIRALNNRGIRTCITMTPLLPLDDPHAFADTLLSTGTTRFIAQPFRLGNQDRGKFIAQTDARAMASLNAHYVDPETDALKKYSQDYRDNTQVLRDRIPALAFGRQGFRPPF